MGGGGKVEVQGLSKLRREMRRLESDVTDLKTANATAAQFVANAAAARAPRRTGRLAASVRGNKAVGKAQVRAGGAAVPYAGPVHWGWPAHGIEANPFVPEAAQDTEHLWMPAYEQDLQRVVDRVGA